MQVVHDGLGSMFVKGVSVANFFFVSVVLVNLFVAMLSSTYDDMNKVRIDKTLRTLHTFVYNIQYFN
jgi:hypothetical protein